MITIEIHQDGNAYIAMYAGQNLAEAEIVGTGDTAKEALQEFVSKMDD